ncbi:Ribonuclease T2 family [Phytophthora infestans]|uniref:Ribonuclease T2 family n=1 Tax=Phytophthora infestans TaxID=4787 RepID=A0A833S6W3_PHYIN|nr:Ribonuclease T2 family [Phytophthora infestans]
MHPVALLLALSSALSAKTPAIDYAGGWTDGSMSSGKCVDICSAPSATCLTKDFTCLAKEKVPGDFDYLVLEQLFVPQFCRDLLVGVDGTISHQNVNPYPNGTACVPERAVSKLTIHGLWPNYNDGYVSCCNPSDAVENDPYDAVRFSENQATLLAEMGDKWIDASTESTYDSLCDIYDHEFQKHGICYAAQGADLEAAAVTYFKATLSTADRISTATEQINAWAALDTPQTTLAAIEALYDHKVMIFCSARTNSQSSARATRHPTISAAKAPRRRSTVPMPRLPPRSQSARVTSPSRSFHTWPQALQALLQAPDQQLLRPPRRRLLRRSLRLTLRPMPACSQVILSLTRELRSER